MALSSRPLSFFLRNRLLSLRLMSTANEYTARSDNFIDTAEFEAIDDLTFTSAVEDGRRLPKTKHEFLTNIKSPVQQPANARFLNVSVIGMPNAGKSTLTNQLVGTRISSVSKRVHTTRRNVLGIAVEGSTQIVFSDSPGLVTTAHCVKHHLEYTFRTQPEIATRQSDVVLVVVDVANPRERQKLNSGIIEKLEKHRDKEAALVLNKVDLIKKKPKLFYITTTLTEGMVNGLPYVEKVAEGHKTFQLPQDPVKHMANVEERLRRKGYILDLKKDDSTNQNFIDLEEDNSQRELTENERRGWPHFSRVFMISALTGDGITELRDYLVDRAYPGNWKFPANLITVQDPPTMVRQVVKEKLLDHLPNEIPYTISTQIQSWDITRTGTLCVVVNLIVLKRHYMALLIGPNGETISKIVDDSRQELANTFKSDVMIKICAKCVDKPK